MPKPIVGGIVRPSSNELQSSQLVVGGFWRGWGRRNVEHEGVPEGDRSSGSVRIGRWRVAVRAGGELGDWELQSHQPFHSLSPQRRSHSRLSGMLPISF